MPAWVQTIGVMVAEKVRVRALCGRCEIGIDVDLAALMEKVGPAYSLLGRRCRCRLTAGCAGWVKFHYMGHGCMRTLWLPTDDERWMASDRHLINAPPPLRSRSD